MHLCDFEIVQQQMERFLHSDFSVSQSYFAEVLGRDVQWLNGGDSGTGKLTPGKPMKEVVI